MRGSVGVTPPFLGALVAQGFRRVLVRLLGRGVIRCFALWHKRLCRLGSTPRDLLLKRMVG